MDSCLHLGTLNNQISDPIEDLDVHVRGRAGLSLKQGVLSALAVDGGHQQMPTDSNQSTLASLPASSFVWAL